MKRNNDEPVVLCPCGQPASTTRYGRGGAARKAGMCMPCFRLRRQSQSPDTPPPPAPSETSNPFADLNALLEDLNNLTRDISIETTELLERARRWTSDCKHRVERARGTAALIESQVRESAAELRRGRAFALDVREDLRRVMPELPEVSHGGNGKQRAV